MTPAWQPVKPRLRPVRLLVAWIGQRRRRLGGVGDRARLHPRGARRRLCRGRRHRRVQRRAAAARGRAAAAGHPGPGLSPRAGGGRAGARAGGRGPSQLRSGRRLRLGAARGAGDRRRVDGPPGHPGHQRPRRLRPAGGQPRGPPPGGGRAHRRARDRLPGDRRAGAARSAAGDAERQRPGHGPLDGGAGLPAHRVGARPLLADRGQPGGHPAGQQRGHTRVSLGGQGRPHAGGVLLPRRLRRDRSAPLHRSRPAGRRRREPRQPALRRRRARRSSR